MKINNKKVAGVVELELWETEGIFRVVIENWTLFKDDPILKLLSDAVLERLREMQGHPKFDGNITDFAVVALTDDGE